MNEKLQEKKKAIENFVTCFKPDWPATSFYGEDGYEPGDEGAPFFTEAFLYNLIGKEDARVVLAIVEGLLEEAERLEGENSSLMKRIEELAKALPGGIRVTVEGKQ